MPEATPGWTGDSSARPEFEFEMRRPADERRTFFQKLREFGHAQNWPASVANEVELVFEEWITDVLDYGVDIEPAPYFKVQLFCEEPLARFVIADNGVPFDPTAIPPPDVNKPAEERPIGGLGIFMMRNLARSMTYARQNGLNILTIRKSLHEPSLTPREPA